jgi:hypothetical protein
VKLHTKNADTNSKLKIEDQNHRHSEKKHALSLSVPHLHLVTVKTAISNLFFLTRKQSREREDLKQTKGRPQNSL